MPAQRKRQGKFQNEGASPKRGAPNARMVVTVKTEPLENEGVTSALRRTIMSRREAQGLEQIQVGFVNSVSHELTSEEIERRERRKEQNRRAARKCRMKKRQQQNSVAHNYQALMAMIREKEEEIRQLKAQKDSLEQTLEDHKRSGHCRFCQAGEVTQESSVQMIAPASTSSSVAVMSGTETSSSVLDLKSYFQDMDPSLLDSIADLAAWDISQVLEDIENEPSALSPNIPSTLHEQLPQVQISPNPMDCLKTLMPCSPLAPCSNQSLLCPISPAANQDRRSVSSVASDWSEYSQGFSMPAGSPVPKFSESGGGGYPVGRGSESEYVGSNLPSGGFSVLGSGLPDFNAEEEGDDDVFSGFHSNTITDEAVLQHLFKKN